MRRTFYLVLAALFPLFFLLHWNGLLAVTYHWALVAVGGTQSFLPQLVISFVSALAIFAAIAALFEAGRLVAGRPSGRPARGR